MSDRIYQAGYRSGKRQGRAEVKAEVQAIADAWNELLSDEQEYIVEQFPQLEPLRDALTEENKDGA